MTWYSTANSSFGADMGAPLGGGFQVNVFLRDGDTVYRTYNTQGRGTEQLSHTFPLIDLLPYGRQEEWQDSPPGWPQSPTYSRWAPPEAFAAYAERDLTGGAGGHQVGEPTDGAGADGAVEQQRCHHHRRRERHDEGVGIDAGVELAAVLGPGHDGAPRREDRLVVGEHDTVVLGVGAMWP